MSHDRPYPRRLIEVDLPIKEISAHARREKSIRHGHISTLHIWWARRPLAACRAVILAALWPDPADPLCPARFREESAGVMKEWRNRRGGPQRNWNDPTAVRTALLDFIADFANWDNSTDAAYLDIAKRLVQVAHESLGGEPGTRPLVVDPFAGGGAIPLEALRVGADAFASDLNPIPVLLNKVVLEYIPRYGDRFAEELKRWGHTVRELVDAELRGFYPPSADGGSPIAYLWARTARCEGPGCGTTVPLIRSPVLASRRSKSVSIVCRGDAATGHVVVDIVQNGRADAKPTVRRGSVTCPLCGYTTPSASVRKQFLGRGGGTIDARMLCVISVTPGATGKSYRPPTRADEQAFARALATWTKLKTERTQDGLSTIPDEPLPYLRSIFNIQLLGVSEWGQLHTPRQAVALAICSKAVRSVWPLLVAEYQDRDLATAIHLCMGLAVDRVADRMTSLCRWIHQNEAVGYTFGRQALGIVWDYVELSPTVNESAWAGIIDSICNVLTTNSRLSIPSGTAAEASATRHPLPNGSASCMCTDPPYYDAVPYADLSDFFFVWLKRTLGVSHPWLGQRMLTPKEDEIVQLAERNPTYSYKTKQRYEKLMTDAMNEGRRIVSPGGIGVVVFAHKSTESWETQLKAMIDAGWTITGSWPIDTEKPGRMRANNSAALASSIHIAVRPRENQDGSVQSDSVGDWRPLLRELPVRIHEWMPRLAREGVVGADAIFACLGPALEIFSRYSRVEKASGERVELREYLEQVWAAVAREALSMIFEDADATGLEEDARLTAMWLWTLSTSSNGGSGASVAASGDDAGGDEEEESAANVKAGPGFTLEFDAARKIAQGLGAHLEDLGRVVEIKGDQARLLSVAERTRHLFGKDQAQRAPARRAKKKMKQLTLFEELEAAEKDAGWGNVGLPPLGETTLDRVHQAMVLFTAGRSEALKRFLVEEGIGRDTRFWKLAQALSALYPTSTDEKRWVDGVLARKKGLGF